MARPGVSSIRSFFQVHWGSCIAGGLLLLFVLLAVCASTRESPTFDEALHLTTGYLYWTHPHTPLWPDLGIFSQAWAALPLLLDHLQFSETPLKHIEEWTQGYQFFYTSGNDPTPMLFQARLMISLLGAALGALVFIWSRRLFGTLGGIISLLLFILSPTMLANAALATTDMAAALGFFSATLAFWNLSHKVSLKNIVLSVLASGCLVLAKMSSVLIAPIFLLILLVRIFSNEPIERLFLAKRTYCGAWLKAGIGSLLLAVHLVCIIIIIRLAYNFSFNAWGEAAIRNQILNAPGFSPWSEKGMITCLVDKISQMNLLPPAYLEGLSYQLVSGTKGGFLHGVCSRTGFLIFYPVAFLIKTPICTLVLMLTSLVTYVYMKSDRLAEKPPISRGDNPACPRLYQLTPLLILGGVYAAACFQGGQDLGIRYFMPVYPVLFVLAGANAYWLRSANLNPKIAIALLLGGSAFECLAVGPHYLAFFNEFVGGPWYGYRFLADSSIDWGQDLPDLARWLRQDRASGDSADAYFSYSGTASTRYYGIDAYRLPGHFGCEGPIPEKLNSGIYIISASSLPGLPWSAETRGIYAQVQAETARWQATSADPIARESLLAQKGDAYWKSCLRLCAMLQFDRLRFYVLQREPDDEVGYSILIYRLSDQALKEALNGPLPNEPRL
jgi:hypothetical protein